jgi:hypothetical protein
MNSRDFMDVAVLIVTAVVRAKSIVLLDGLTYVFSPESVRMTIADALQVEA